MTDLISHLLAADEVENHERIWLGPLCHDAERCWCQDPQPCNECGLPAIEYIRADIATSEWERLKLENARLRKALKRLEKGR